EAQVGNHLPQLPVLVLELLEPPHLRRQQAFVLLLPIEVGSLADPGLTADIRYRYAVSTLLENERLLGVRKPRSLHRSRLLPAQGITPEDSNQKGSSFPASEQPSAEWSFPSPRLNSFSAAMAGHLGPSAVE